MAAIVQDSKTLSDLFEPPKGTPPGKPWALLVNVTPELAAQFLDLNDHNRNLRWDEIDAAARDIENDAYDLNGETGKFDRNGKMLDGQHRMNAIVKAKKPVEMFLVFGLEPEVQDTVDTGLKRTIGDQLTLAGNYNGVVLGSLARWAIQWQNGTRAKGAAIKPTHREIKGFIKENPIIRDAVEFAISARRDYRSIQVSVWGMSWWLFTGTQGSTEAEEFLNNVIKGADIGTGHPAYELRERIRRAVEAQQRLNRFEQIALMITAWNAWQDRRHVTTIRLPTGGLTPKNFPEPK